MTWIFVVAFVLVIGILIAADMVKERKATLKEPQASEQIRAETERMVRLETEVDEKLREIQRHQGVVPPSPIASAALAAAPTEARDPLNDTRCMQAVKEKAAEIERIAKERGLS